MRLIYSSLLILSGAASAFGQFPQIDYAPNREEKSIISKGPGDAERVLELLNGGQMEVYSTGITHAALQILKLRIGEKDGFSVPFYLTVGNSGAAFGKKNTAKQAIATLIDPIGGVLNASFIAARTVYGSGGRITKLHFSTQGSSKFQYIEDTTDDTGILSPSAYLDFGPLFQTGLWEHNDFQEGGVLWLQLKYSLILGMKQDIERLFGGIDSGFLHGIKLDVGMVIKNRVNFRVGAFIPTESQGIDVLDSSIAKFAFDYKVGG